MYPIRDRILDSTQLPDDGVLLDVGCGDGLIAFGALERFPNARVVFSDISQELLEHAKALAEEGGFRERCDFIQAAADDLSPFPDASVDAATMRSVLIYVGDKRRAFNEFYRVLKPGGWLSLFEPVLSINDPEVPGRFMGYEVSPVTPLAERVKAVFADVQPRDTNPMYNFDEEDLLTYAEAAGFSEIFLSLQLIVRPMISDGLNDWDAFSHSAPNPKAPTIAEAMREALTEAEARRFETHLRPQVEAGRGIKRSAGTYLQALKHPDK